MKKPGVLPISFLVKEDDQYREYYFSVGVAKWGNLKKARIRYILKGTDRGDIPVDYLTTYGYLTEDEFQEKAEYLFNHPIEHFIFGEGYPMKLERMLQILLEKEA